MMPVAQASWLKFLAMPATIWYKPRSRLYPVLRTAVLKMQTPKQAMAQACSRRFQEHCFVRNFKPKAFPSSILGISLPACSFYHQTTVYQVNICKVVKSSSRHFKKQVSALPMGHSPTGEFHPWIILFLVLARVKLHPALRKYCFCVQPI